MSINGLATGHRHFPKSGHPSETISRYLPKIFPVFTPTPDIWEENVGKQQTYNYHFVHTKVKELVKKELVRIQNSAHHEDAKVIEFTFQGLMCYLQNMKDPNKSSGEKFRHTIDNYPMLIPFLKQWDSLTKDLGEDKCIRAFSKTVKEFVDIRNVKSRIPSTNQVFDGFVKRPLYHSEIDAKITVERDNDVAKCLEKKKMSVLRDCYIAYLVVNDIDKSPEENEGLESEREFAYFEKRDKSADTLFKGEKLREYLPKYSSIEYFFTGMFVKNLLWSERTV